MPDLNFKVGDKVIYELAINSDHLPRWNFNTEAGSSGKFVEGTVWNIDEKNHCITIILVNGNYWEWSLEGHYEYRSDQWERPGYLRLKNLAIDNPSKKITTRWDNLFEE